MGCPLSKFQALWDKALDKSPLEHKSAVCVSTISEHGFPHGRFVDLKAVTDQGFVFCTHLSSQKGLDIGRDSRIALTAWWDHIGLQVRVSGYAEKLDEEVAKQYWLQRSRDAQITTVSCQQSQPVESEVKLIEQFNQSQQKFDSVASIPKPHDWGGYVIKPVSIEFLSFKQSRLHTRELYENRRQGWQKSLLQP